ncbi:hypothetical protein D3C81_2014480 [compost metagenome]
MTTDLQRRVVGTDEFAELARIAGEQAEVDACLRPPQRLQQTLVATIDAAAITGIQFVEILLGLQHRQGLLHLLNGHKPPAG